MSVFPLNTNTKNGTVLHPQSSFYTEEYARRMCNWYLTDHVQKDGNGDVRKSYQLHSSEPRSFADFMAYDILCPKCGQRMHPIANAVNSHDLALYTCSACNKR